MSKPLPHEILADPGRARELHDRAASDYEKCVEFNALMAKVLDQLEDGGHERHAGKVMSLLLDCSPREGVRCDKTTLVGERVKKL